MSISQKCYYALRAVFELARHDGENPMKIGQIAESQKIPVRFLEVILNQLKQGGFVQSRRGNEGGYRLARPARQLTVGEVIRFVEGPLAPVDCARPGAATPDGCPFLPMWNRVEKALSDIYDQTTFEDLVEQARGERPVDFAI